MKIGLIFCRRDNVQGLGVHPMIQKADRSLSCILKAIRLGLTFIKFAVKCCLENRRVETGEVLMDNELFIALASVKCDQLGRFPRNNSSGQSPFSTFPCSNEDSVVQRRAPRSRVSWRRVCIRTWGLEQVSLTFSPGERYLRLVSKVKASRLESAYSPSSLICADAMSISAGKGKRVPTYQRYCNTEGVLSDWLLRWLMLMERKRWEARTKIRYF